MAWTPNLKTGFTVQRGYRSGGSSGNIARSATFSYDPEFTWNYELSLRSAWLDGRLTLNANAFYVDRSEEHTSELQSLMRISYAVFCLKKKTTTIINTAPCTIVQGIFYYLSKSNPQHTHYTLTLLPNETLS